MAEKNQNWQSNPLASATERISMKLIDEFPNHPFYIIDDNKMYELPANESLAE